MHAHTAHHPHTTHRTYLHLEHVLSLPSAPSPFFFPHSAQICPWSYALVDGCRNRPILKTHTPYPTLLLPPLEPLPHQNLQRRLALPQGSLQGRVDLGGLEQALCVLGWMGGRMVRLAA